MPNGQHDGIVGSPDRLRMGHRTHRLVIRVAIEHVHCIVVLAEKTLRVVTRPWRPTGSGQGRRLGFYESVRGPSEHAECTTHDPRTSYHPD